MTHTCVSDMVSRNFLQKSQGTRGEGEDVPTRSAMSRQLLRLDDGCVHMWIYCTIFPIFVTFKFFLIERFSKIPFDYDFPQKYKIL